VNPRIQSSFIEEAVMATRTWNEDRASKRIKAKIDALPVKDIEIKD